MYICIEGNIGAGKTTLARELATLLKAEFLPERFEENVLLPLFYSKPKTFAFPTEYSFLIDRHKQLFNYFGESRKKATVADFHFDKCLCFAKANLKEKDFVFYKKHFNAMKQTLPVPDLIVYLETSAELLLKNIRKRGREVEKSLKAKYLQKIQRSFDTYYLAKQKSGARILHLRMEEYSAASLASSCKTIQAAMKHLAQNRHDD
jgi:deoxyadenosine/deoxycytidine kinase